MLPRLLSGTRVVLFIHVVGFFLWNFLLDSASQADFRDLFGLVPSGIIFDGGGSFGFWQPLTYWIFIDSAFQIFMVGLVLWLFFPTIELQFGARRFLSFYVFVLAMSGFLVSLLAPPHLFDTGAVLGPEAAVIGGLVAMAYFRPNDTVLLMFFIPVRVKWLAIGAIVILLLVSLEGGAEQGGASSWVQIAGAVSGLLFCLLFYPEHNRLWSSRRRNLGTLPRNSRIFQSGPGFFSSGPSRPEQHGAQFDDSAPGNEELAEIEEVIDRKRWEKKRFEEILERVSKKGISSLTPQEKEILGRSATNHPRKKSDLSDSP